MKDSKEHILVTSFNLFLQKSFKEVTMSEIVEKTGLSKGAFYHYFSSKEQVFEEVINHFYSDLISTDYSRFSQSSLAEFCEDWMKEKKDKLVRLKEKTRDSVAEGFSANQYFLIFDAMRMLPGFKKLRSRQQENELNAWISVIESAKKSGEISSRMSSGQLAKIFNYSAKGIAIDSVMSGRAGNSQKEIKELWDELYQLLKTK